jgi:phytoene/squalene synthetase
MMHLYDQSSYNCSKQVTKLYSTSFSLGIRMFSVNIRPAIYAIYGFVRYADEIVDTFHGHDQEVLIKEFQAEYQKAVERKISLNPILHSFQQVVNQYKLHELVACFIKSMRMDLMKSNYITEEEYKEYIYGSADVVGLMCLKIFVNGDEEKYKELKPYAQKLGSAFQKVNFLRDIKNDMEELGRSYFPNMDSFELNNETKEIIIKDIEADFKEAYIGIKKLPIQCKLGVYVAYRYYKRLLHQLKLKDSSQLMEHRIRVSNPFKALILFKSYVRFKLNMI